MVFLKKNSLRVSFERASVRMPWKINSLNLSTWWKGSGVRRSLNDPRVPRAREILELQKTRCPRCNLFFFSIFISLSSINVSQSIHVHEQCQGRSRYIRTIIAVGEIIFIEIWRFVFRESQLKNIAKLETSRRGRDFRAGSSILEKILQSMTIEFLYQKRDIGAND